MRSNPYLKARNQTCCFPTQNILVLSGNAIPTVFVTFLLFLQYDSSGLVGGGPLLTGSTWCISACPHLCGSYSTCLAWDPQFPQLDTPVCTLEGYKKGVKSHFHRGNSPPWHMRTLACILCAWNDWFILRQ